LTEKDKLINDTSETFKNFEPHFRITKTENGFFISRKSVKLSELIFVVVFLLIIPISLVYYETNKTTIIISIIWEIIFTYILYQIMIADNKLDFDLKEKKLKIENIGLILEHFISPKNVKLNTIKNFEFKRIKHTRYGLASTRLVAIFENSEKQILNDFDSKEGAKRIEFMINKLKDKTAGNTVYKT
jgi:hypothetical protein